jgi:hypothetical protein
MYCTYSNVSTKFQFEYTNYIYSNKNPNLIPFSKLILGTKVPQSLSCCFTQLQYGLRREHLFLVSPLAHVMNLLPSNGRSLQSHYLATGLHVTLYIFLLFTVKLWVFYFLYFWRRTKMQIMKPTNRHHMSQNNDK